MPYEVDWRPAATEDVLALFEYLAEEASLWDAHNVTERILRSTDKLAEFPGCTKPTRAMAMEFAALAWLAKTCSTRWTTRPKVRVLAVVGQRQNAKQIR